MTARVACAVRGEGAIRLGHLTLDAPKTLNSLTLPMVDTLSAQLLAWRDDPSIAAVFIDGTGDKAFCAGGDVQALRDSCLATPGGPCEYAEMFFAREYAMNYLLHTYPKPVVCWGHGVVMGGGLGILAGCSHRLVSERTRIGMPEITIALFPDVGGSWFLNRMPGNVGRFLALTAATINATDALYSGLGSHYLGADQHSQVLAALTNCDWSSTAQENRQLTDQVLAAITATTALPDPNIEGLRDEIERWMEGDDLLVIAERIRAWEGDNVWLQKAQAGFLHGSSLAASWIFRQLNETQQASLEEVFRSELRLGTNIMRHPEFAEGVRALLIEKDRKPAWTYPSIKDIPSTVLDGFFSAPENAPILELVE